MVVDAEQAAKPGAPVVHEDLGTNVVPALDHVEPVDRGQALAAHGVDPLDAPAPDGPADERDEGGGYPATFGSPSSASRTFSAGYS